LTASPPGPLHIWDWTLPRAGWTDDVVNDPNIEGVQVGATMAPTKVIVPLSTVPPPPAFTANGANIIATEQVKANQRCPRIVLPSTGARANRRYL
jgi:hypothetical protein